MFFPLATFTEGDQMIIRVCLVSPTEKLLLCNLAGQFILPLPTLINLGTGDTSYWIRTLTAQLELGFESLDCL